MEQFSLEKYLENPSRKVVTRNGKPIRIICWDLKCNTPIIAAIQWNQEREDCYCYNTVGRCANNEGELDLFFANEEEKLTEFEKELQIIISEASHWTSDDGSISTYCQFGDKEIKKISGQILDLARKELEKEVGDKCWEAHLKGEEEALKDLPKWKKANDNLRLNAIVPHLLDDVLYWKGYYIWMKELEKLPKE